MACRLLGSDGRPSPEGVTGAHGPRTGSDRQLRPAHHLCAPVGHRPLRPPLPLLHGREDGLPAARRSADARGDRPARRRLHRPGREADPADRRRAPGPARHRRSRCLARRAYRARPRRADPDHQRHAGWPISPAGSTPRACGGSMSASTASNPNASATSPASAIWRRCWTASRRRPPPGCASRSTWSRSRASTKTRSSAMLLWCAERGHDLTLIETMPLGAVEADRSDHYLPLDAVRQRLEQRYALTPALSRTGGPARYYEVGGLGVRLGLITPLTGNFCTGCNRVRVTATGTSYGCLGQDQKVELRDLMRAGEPLDDALDALMAGKPKGHDFRIGAPASRRGAPYERHRRLMDPATRRPDRRVHGGRGGALFLGRPWRRLGLSRDHGAVRGGAGDDAADRAGAEPGRRRASARRATGCSGPDQFQAAARLRGDGDAGRLSRRRRSISRPNITGLWSARCCSRRRSGCSGSRSSSPGARPRRRASSSPCRSAPRSACSPG